MGFKHDILTKKEFGSYQLDSKIRKFVVQYLQENPNLDKHDIRILDWGCGRGRGVLKLLEEGFSSFGVDIDRSVLDNGSPLFEEYEYNPENHLMTPDQLAEFPGHSFHFIFSEQVFEHVENIE